MAQPAQVFATNSPNNTFVVIDNSAAGVVITAAGTPQITNNQTGINADGATLGFDTPTVARVPSGSSAQGLNSFANTGTTTLDSVNDTVYAPPEVATFPGNPVSMTAPTYKTVTTVINTVSGQRLLWKNPA